MIERKFILRNLKEFSVKEYVRKQVKKAGVSDVRVQKTPLGEKIVILTPRPGLVVGRKGQNIRLLTEDLKNKFNMENPKIEIEEVDNINLDPFVVADKIANSLEKYGINRFKAIGHKALESTMKSGARGIEILISGKVPSSRARTWRFYAGYMKKSGEFNKHGVSKAHTYAKLKTGIVGIKVRIMLPNVKLPDAISIRNEPIQIVEEVLDEMQTKKLKTASKKSSKEKKVKTSTKKQSKSKLSEKKVGSNVVDKTNGGKTKEILSDNKNDNHEDTNMNNVSKSLDNKNDENKISSNKNTQKVDNKK